MTTQENQDSLKNYQFLKTIGEGTFGKVKLSLHLLTNELVAIKILEKSRITDQEELERVEKEIKYLKLFEHPNIIQLYEVIENEYNYYIIMEYIQNGEFFNYIVEKERIEEKEASFFYSQIIHGIAEINKKSICHRDIKPENLLLTKEKIIKIIDFGLSNEYIDTLNTQCGSPCYAAPEIIRGMKYNGLMVDIWASGIILFAMLFGFLPFDDKDNNILFRKILECNLEFPNDIEVSNEAKDLIKRILRPNPNERIKLDEILNHPFLMYGNKQYRKMIKPLRFNKSRLIIEYMVHVLNFSNKGNCIFKAVNENKHNGITTTFKLLKKQLIENKFNYKLLEDKLKNIKPYVSPVKHIHIKQSNFNNNNKKNQISYINNINILNKKNTERTNLIKAFKENKENKINKAHSTDNTKIRGTKKIKKIKKISIDKKKKIINDNNEKIKRLYLNYLFEKKIKLKPLLNIKKINKRKIDTSVSIDKKKTTQKKPQKKTNINPFRNEYDTFTYKIENNKIIYIPSNLTNKIRGKSDNKIKSNNNIKNKQITTHIFNNNNKMRYTLTPINQHRYMKYRGLSTDIPNKFVNRNIQRINKDKHYIYLNSRINNNKEINHHFKTISNLEENNSLLKSNKKNNSKINNITKTPKSQIKQNIICNKYNTIQNSPNEKKNNQFVINANIIYNCQFNNSSNKCNNNIIKRLLKNNNNKKEYTPLNLRNKKSIQEFKDLSKYSEKKRTIISTFDGNGIIYPKKEIKKFYIRNDNNINPQMKHNHYISSIK